MMPGTGADAGFAAMPRPRPLWRQRPAPMDIKPDKMPWILACQNLIKGDLVIEVLPRRVPWAKGVPPSDAADIPRMMRRCKRLA
ncbi:MAG: hypothetical protein ACLSAH_21610 [Bilophila wadsworthia]